MELVSQWGKQMINTVRKLEIFHVFNVNVWYAEKLKVGMG